MYASAEDKAIYQDDAKQFIIEALYDNLANLPLNVNFVLFKWFIH